MQSEHAKAIIIINTDMGVTESFLSNFLGGGDQDPYGEHPVDKPLTWLYIVYKCSPLIASILKLPRLLHKAMPY